MKKLLSLNISSLLAILVVLFIVYFILLQDNFLHISISSVIAHAHHLEIKKRLLLHGFLPIYIATIIFGAALLGNYVGKTVQQFIYRLLKLKPRLAKKSN